MAKKKNLDFLYDPNEDEDQEGLFDNRLSKQKRPIQRKKRQTNRY